MKRSEYGLYIFHEVICDQCKERQTYPLTENLGVPFISSNFVQNIPVVKETQSKLE
jgi:hypothetical protein